MLCAALAGLQLPPLSPGAPAHVLSVRYATEHRAGAVLRGPGLCDRVTGTGAARLVTNTRARTHTYDARRAHTHTTDPLRDGLPLARSEPLDASPLAAHTAAVVNQARACVRGFLA